MKRPLRSARVLSGALFLGAVGAALAPAGPDALVPFKLLAASAADQVYAAVVVDFGNGQITSNCVPVSPGESDEQALAQVYSVEANNSGLICDINNVPTSDTSQCLRTGGNNQFYYWSYWHGSTGTWVYSSVGPSSFSASSGDVQGWRYQNPGADNPSAPPPEASANFQSICAGHISPPTTTPTAPPPVVTSPTVVHNSPTPTTAKVSGSTSPGHTTTTTTKSGAAVTTTSDSAGHDAPISSSGSDHPPANGSTQHQGATALASHSQPSGGSGGAPILPIVLAGIAIVLLGVLSFFGWRRMPAEE
jgi:hypothetical protein